MPAVGLAIQLIINGDGSFHYSPQNDAADGTASGPVTVIGTHNNVTGNQAVQAGGDATVTPAQDQPSKEGWWARLRKRGMIVATATIIGAIAVVIGTAVAICTWIGWTP